MSKLPEQMTVNHQVGGSNPSKSAFKVKKIVIGLAYFSFRKAVKLPPIYRERRGRERIAEENRSVLMPSMACLQGRISGGESNGSSESPLTQK